MRAGKTPWIVIETKEAGHPWHCRRCDDRYTMNLPCSIGVLSAAMRAFQSEHRGCREPRAKR